MEGRGLDMCFGLPLVYYLFVLIYLLIYPQVTTWMALKISSFKFLLPLSLLYLALVTWEGPSKTKHFRLPMNSLWLSYGLIPAIQGEYKEYKHRGQA